jgi:hypothetical protein
MDPDTVSGLEAWNFGYGQGLACTGHLNGQAWPGEVEGRSLGPKQMAGKKKDQTDKRTNTTKHLIIVRNSVQ